LGILSVGEVVALILDFAHLLLLEVIGHSSDREKAILVMAYVHDSAHLSFFLRPDSDPNFPTF
jgi:hypothetical protein